MFVKNLELEKENEILFETTENYKIENQKLFSI